MRPEPRGEARGGCHCGASASPRFAFEVTDFLICDHCGTYVGATAEIGGRRFATLNRNAFDDPRLDLDAIPASHEGESAEARATRRLAVWTPRFVE